MNVSFYYRNKEYFAIVRHRCAEGHCHFAIRIMNNRLDTLLTKNNLHLIPESDGNITELITSPQSDIENVHQAIADEVRKQLEQDKHQRGFERISDFRLITPN